MCAALSGTNDKPNLIGQNKWHSIECHLPYKGNKGHARTLVTVIAVA